MISIAAHPPHEILLARLVAAGLPTDDVAPGPYQTFFGAREDEDWLAVIGLEALGHNALLRSLAVDAGQRDRGIGAALVDAVERHARALGVAQMYLLTTGASAYFARLGYAPVERESVPGTIRSTAQFSALCPRSAAVMVKRLT